MVWSPELKFKIFRKIRSAVAEMFYFLYFEVVFHSTLSSIRAFWIWLDHLSLGLKFEGIRSLVAEIFNFWYFEVLFHLMLSLLQAFFILVWSPELQFQIKGRSVQWLLIYSTFKILRSSSIGGHLCFKHFQFCFGHLSLSFKFEDDPISSCWDIQFLIF